MNTIEELSEIACAAKDGSGHKLTSKQINQYYGTIKRELEINQILKRHIEIKDEHTITFQNTMFDYKQNQQDFHEVKVWLKGDPKNEDNH